MSGPIIFQPTYTGDSVDLLAVARLTAAVTPIAPNPRESAVPAVLGRLSEPINPSTFTTASLSLSDDGGPNLITASGPITVTQLTSTTYEIGGLTTPSPSPRASMF